LIYRWRSEQKANTAVALITGLSYTYLHSTINDDAPVGESEKKLSQYALQNLRHQLCANANFEFFHTLNITVAARYQQRVSFTDYTLLDARISFTRRQFNIYADVNNIADVQYIEAGAVPMPGRWVTLGIKWAWWDK
jgi:vitamin B12 transporter